MRIAALLLGISLGLTACSPSPKETSASPASAATPSSQPSTSQPAPKNDPATRLQAIPPADLGTYMKVRDMRQWKNPFLILQKDGVALLDVANSEQRMLKPEELTEALAALPASAWPYGRVVAVQEASITGSDEDKAAFRRNRAVIAGTLHEVHVVINWVSGP